jgi:CHAT domain-containing protein
MSCLPPCFPWLLGLFLLVAPLPARAQDPKQAGFQVLENFLAADRFQEADSAVTFLIGSYKSTHHYDSLAALPYYAGWAKHQRGNTTGGIQAAENLVGYLESKTKNAQLLREAYLELALFYELIGNADKAYAKNQRALHYTSQMPSATDEDFGKIENNLGVLAQRFGDMALSSIHHRRASKYFANYPNTNAENFYLNNNAMGGLMWFSSKADSAIYYYEKALENLRKMEPTPKNVYYRQAVVQNNLSGLLDSQGKKTEALQMMRDVIKHLQAYRQAEVSQSEKVKATEFLYQGVDNLAGAYKSMGNYTKALELLRYSYQQKQTNFEPDNPEIFKSLVLLGQAELALKNYQSATTFLDKGLAILEKTPESHHFWQADANYSKAIIQEELGNPVAATAYYQKTESLYERALQGEYDNIFLEFLTRSSLFYAKSGNRSKAKEAAFKGYHYILKTQGENTLQAFLQQLNLAAVHYELGDYQAALTYSKEGISVLNQASSRSAFFIDSVQIESNKPRAILLQTKSQYRLQQQKDPPFLEGLMSQLNEAVAILERHKSVFSSPEDLTVLIHENKEVFDFAKKIALELYFKTSKTAYLDRTLSLHESAMYNRIRSRLNAREALRFSQVPDSVFVREKQIRVALKEALRSTDNHPDQSIQSFFKLTSQWEDFLAGLKKNYPRYYTMRYATIAEPVEAIQSRIPAGTTVVRYFFVEKELFALLLDHDTKQVYKLDYPSAGGAVEKLTGNQLPFEETARLLQQLYQQLWAPLAAQVKTKPLIIIPDGELFNLSFEMLTPERITSYADLARRSLLANHLLSYNYSLLLLKADEASPAFQDPLVAFVPGFSDDIKQQYRKKIADSLQMDATYLRLLPQPFTSDLVHHLQTKFGGEAFLQEQSTKQNFKTAANRHRILHIGTHAESNNVSPELSRLLFAKDLSRPDAEENNSLYAFEIYTYELASNLTILTACETGKPGYQAGEGMISLAHAFNYSGSQSILTSLWKVDEQASATIVARFYEYLAEGQTKDQALRQSKLDYLAQAEGRSLSPHYWAGLMVMGDTSPVQLSTLRPWIFWVIGALFVCMLGAVFFRFYRRKSLPVEKAS